MTHNNDIYKNVGARAKSSFLGLRKLVQFSIFFLAASQIVDKEFERYNNVEYWDVVFWKKIWKLTKN